MFVGSINAKVKNLIYAERDTFRGKKVCVGCSGNFTVEQILSGVGCEIWSNDISLYSSLLGNHLAGNEMRVGVRDGRYSWLKPYLEPGGIERISAVSLLFEMLKSEKASHLNQIRLYDHYRNNFKKYHEQSCERISKTMAGITISRYTSLDVHDLYADLSSEWCRIAFLPTYVAGYEKLYSRLENVLSWDRPHYEILTEQRYEQTVVFMRSGECLYLADHDRNEDGLFSIVKTGRLKNVYLYSNLPFKKSYIALRTKSTAGKIPFLPETYEISPASRISFLKTDNYRMNYYKNLFLKKGIEHVQGTFPLLVLLDGYLFGFLMYDIIRYGLDQEQATRGIYLLSDFVINSPIKRLSKLLLLTTRTRELQRMLKEKFIQPVEFVLTTAFTKKPVSMKYRGVFKLSKRGDGFLQYTAPCGTINTKEAIETWIKKYK